MNSFFQALSKHFSGKGVSALPPEKKLTHMLIDMY